MILRGLAHGQGDGATEDSLKAELRSGDLNMWVAQDASGVVAGMIFRVIEYPAKKSVFIELVAGRGLNEWFDKEFHLLEEFKDMIGADVIEASCRPGLARFLESRGWHRKAVIMEAPK